MNLQLDFTRPSSSTRRICGLDFVSQFVKYYTGVDGLRYIDSDGEDGLIMNLLLTDDVNT